MIARTIKAFTLWEFLKAHALTLRYFFKPKSVVVDDPEYEATTLRSEIAGKVMARHDSGLALQIARHHVITYIEMKQAALRLRAPIVIGGYVDRAHRIAFAARCYVLFLFG